MFSSLLPMIVLVERRSWVRMQATVHLRILTSGWGVVQASVGLSFVLACLDARRVNATSELGTTVRGRIAVLFPGF